MTTRRLLMLGFLALAVLPGCSPKKNTDPQPPDAACSVVIFYNSTTESPAEAAVYTSPILRHHCLSCGHSFRLVDVSGDEPMPDYLKPYTDKLDKDKVPVLMLGRAGKVKHTQALTATVDELIKDIDKKVGAEADDVGSVFVNGQRRWLGCTPVKPGADKRWPTEGGNDEPLVPKKDWKELTFEEEVCAILDQDGYSSCCPCSATNALRTARNRTGLKDTELSVVDLYSRINGGRDRGASIEDALEQLDKEGVCSTNVCPMWGVTKPKHKDGWEADRAKHKIARATWLPSVEHVGSAIQRRRPVVFGTMVTTNFNPKDGVIGPVSGMARGGHAMFLVGYKVIGGEPYFRVVNSWGESWGDHGKAWLHASWFNPQFGAWAIASVRLPSDDKIATKRPARPEPVYATAL